MNILKLLFTSSLCLFLSGCGILFYPVTGFYVRYRLEVPEETKTGDFLQYSFTTQNPIRGWIASEVTERFEPFKKKADDRFVMQAVDYDGKIIWERTNAGFWLTGLPYNRIGRTIFRVCINDPKTLKDLKVGKRSMWMAIIRLDIPEFSFPFSTEIGEETLTPTIVSASLTTSSNQKKTKKNDNSS